MKTESLITSLALLRLFSGITRADPLGTAFTYQGRLTDGANPANGDYDLKFTLYDAANGGNAVGGPITNSPVGVNNGLFTVQLDFGPGVFTGEARWLDIGARTNGGGPFTTLSPRQPLTPAPHALYAANAQLLNGQACATFAPANGSTNYVAKGGDRMTGALQLPADGLAAGSSQLVLSAGNVGIGTSTPSRALSVYNAQNPRVLVDSPAASEPGYEWASAGSLKWLLYRPRNSDDLRLWDDSSDRVTFQHGGNVGIGTTLPGAPLEIAAYGNNLKLSRPGVSTAFGAWEGYWGNNPQLVLGNWDTGNGVALDKDGNVGIGTLAPTAMLDVRGTVRATAFQGDASGLANVALLNSSPTFNGLTLNGDGSLSDHTLFLRAGSFHGLGWYGSGKPFAGVSTIDGPVLFGWNGGALGSTMFGQTTALYWDPYGNVDLYGDLRLSDHDLWLRSGTDDSHGLGWYGGTGRSFAGNQVDGPVLYGYDGGALGSTGGGQRLTLFWNMWGMVGIGTNIPQTTLHVVGTTRTSVLQITGGSDLAEPFEMSTPQVAKGAVVIIDDENAGRLKLSDRAYDTRVAGAVSGANGIQPGLTLSQEQFGDGGQHVALSGRVYVLADAAQGTIKPGDLLTTSDTPGHAMKVTDFTKAHGAILGKAMSGLKEGKGLVLVLVTLQ